MEKKWYIVTTYSGCEEKVKANLEERKKTTAIPDSISQILIPKEEVVEIKNKKNSLEEEIKGMQIIDKARFLLNRGMNQEEVQKMIGVSSGELELILDIENLKK